ncbi:hypothetical protein AMTRI_Chr11g155290 [Amborella trichopoda]
MDAQRVTFLDSLDVEVSLSTPTSLGAIPEGTVKISLLDWDKGNACGYLTIKTPSILAQEEHRIKALFIPQAPPVLVVESSDSSKEDLSLSSKNWSIHKMRREEVRAKVGKILEAMHVHFKDHVPLLLDTEFPPRGLAPFRFELMRLEEPSLKDIIASIRQNETIIGWLGHVFSCKLKTLDMMRSWSKATFGSLAESIMVASGSIDILNSLKQYSSRVTEAQFNSKEVLKNHLEDLLRKEEVFWFQRSRSKWVKEGDNNTKYFNAIANSRCR